MIRSSIALCEPAETFTFGGVFAHIMTFNAHRRLMPWTFYANWASKPQVSAIPWEFEETVAHLEPAVPLKTP